MATRQMWHERVEAQLAAAREASARAQEAAAQLGALTGTATTPDGSVRVRVDHHGFVLDVQVTERAKELGADGLAAAVLRVAQDALADLHRRAAPLQAQVAGPPVDLQDTTMLDDLDAALRGRPTGGDR
ncbi:YbaB/EbfC family nucleoid-associated protein [Cellulomonas sp. Marseille-Q8402]